MLGDQNTMTAILGLSVGGLIVVIVVVVGLYFYFRRRVEAAGGDYGDVAQLATERDQVHAEIEQARQWLQESKEELLRLEAEREAQERLRGELAELEAALGDQRGRVDDARKEALELQHAVTSLADDRERLVREIKSAEARGREVAESLPLEEKRLTKLREQVGEQSAEVRRLTGEAAMAEAALRGAHEQLRTLEEALRTRKAEAEIDKSVTHTLRGERERLTSDVSKLRKEHEALTVERQPAVELMREKQRLDLEVGALRKELEELRAERQHIEESLGVGFARERYADLFDIEPACLSDAVFGDGPLPAELSEEEALESVEQYLGARGLYFPSRVVRSFHTCLKINDINPLTVLAGVSGTGKSELPLRYAEAMGMHRLNVAVQPSWASPQDLFGFYNYLERRYKATDVARALVRMDPHNFPGTAAAFKELAKRSRADRMLLILIDEMNLARVEYYFSEFLSRLETRRAVLHPERSVDRAPAEIEIEGAHKGQGDSERRGANIRVWVGNNVLMTGTMNEDETTQTLSEKVLDRANVLRFGRPARRDLHTNGSGKAPDALLRRSYLPVTVWQSWKRPVDPGLHWLRHVTEWIEVLNDALNRVGRPFGWRVKEAMREYVANYPGSGGGEVFKQAMSDQIEQKILPKLRGLDATQARTQEALREIHGVIDVLGDELLAEAYERCVRDAEHAPFVWQGVTRP